MYIYLTVAGAAWEGKDEMAGVVQLHKRYEARVCEQDLLSVKILGKR